MRPGHKGRARRRHSRLDRDLLAVDLALPPFDLGDELGRPLQSAVTLMVERRLDDPGHPQGLDPKVLLSLNTWRSGPEAPGSEGALRSFPARRSCRRDRVLT